MTTVGYGDKAPITTAGRMIAVMWMFIGIVLLSGITATITTALTVHRLGTRIQGPEDLPGAILFFASDDAAFITGQVLSVSGGLTMVG